MLRVCRRGIQKLLTQNMQTLRVFIKKNDLKSQSIYIFLRVEYFL